MSLYRLALSAVAAIALATPVFAEENTAAQAAASAESTQTLQVADNSASEASVTGSEQTTRTDINKATAKDLAKVKGLNASKARAIVAYRKKHGDFKALDDLKMVKGFKKLNDEQMKMIQDQLSLS